jgi:hypothetical protein
MVLHVVMGCVVMFRGAVRRMVTTRVVMTLVMMNGGLGGRVAWVVMARARIGRRSADGDQTEGGQRKQQYFHGWVPLHGRRVGFEPAPSEYPGHEAGMNGKCHTDNRNRSRPSIAGRSIERPSRRKTRQPRKFSGVGEGFVYVTPRATSPQRGAAHL